MKLGPDDDTEKPTHSKLYHPVRERHQGNKGFGPNPVRLRIEVFVRKAAKKETAEESRKVTRAPRWGERRS